MSSTMYAALLEDPKWMTVANHESIDIGSWYITPTTFAGFSSLFDSWAYLVCFNLLAHKSSVNTYHATAF